MSLRRRTPTDLAAVKKSRGGFTGAVTKAIDKLQGIRSDEPEEVQAINTKDVDRILASLIKTETGFLLTMEDALHFTPTDEEEEEAFSSEEATALETFQESISTARDAAEQLLTLKSVLNGLADFKNTSTAIQEFMDSNPDSNQTHSLQKLDAAFHSMKEEWNKGDLPNTHPLKTELDSCARTLTSLEDAVAAVRDKSDSHSSVTATSSHSSDRLGCCGSKSDLPVIDVPKFHGNIMNWNSFWNSFESTIGSRTDIDNTKRLHYLRMAIKCEETKKLLYSPTETPNFYLDVVKELKRRFDKTKEVHRALTKDFLELQTPKQTRLDLRKLTDQVKRLIRSFKATGHYNIESFLCSTLYLLLPLKLQTLWDQHTKKDKGVSSVDSLVVFLQDHAETLPSCTTEKTGEPSKKTTTRGHQPAKGARNQVNSVTPTTFAYKWDCSLCKPEKHPLHLCPKWASYSLQQKLAHVKAKNLCANCLAGGHPLSNCKSSYRCRECGQNHHTTIHQPAATTSPVNSVVATCHQVQDALMTTAQVLLRGPRGQEVKARALIDSGASLSLLSHKIAQTLGLPLQPSNLKLTGVQGSNSKPVKFFTDLTISPLLNREKTIHCKPAVVQVVTANLPPEKVEPVTEMPHIMGLHLADDQYNIPNKIDILLGADVSHKIFIEMAPRTGNGQGPVVQATQFGWVISGPAKRCNPTGTTTSVNINCLRPEEESAPPLHKLLYEFWDGEEVPGDQEATLSQMEEQAETHYTATLYMFLLNPGIR